VINAHVAQKPCWQKKRTVLHRASLALPGKGELGRVRKDVSAKVAMLLFLHDKGVLERFLVRVINLAGNVTLLRIVFRDSLWRRAALLAVVAVDLGG
jgi:hypothetical protein